MPGLNTISASTYSDLQEFRVSRQPEQQDLSQLLGDGYIPLDDPQDASTLSEQPYDSEELESGTTPAESMLESGLEVEQVDTEIQADPLMQPGAEVQAW